MRENDYRVLLIGSGSMAFEYLRVLKALNKQVVVVGRGEFNLNKLRESFPEFEYHAGGVEKYVETTPFIPELAINTVNIDFLGTTSCVLLSAGVKKLLIEKPGDITNEGLEILQAISKKNNSKVLIGYNRRFYSSILQLLEEVEQDGGIKSCHFEFTEWVHTFGTDTHSLPALNKWLLSNSSHVIDTVFYLLGKPLELNARVLGVNNISWHPSGSIFVGSGISLNHIPFTYHANWGGPGRWSIEIITAKRRFYLRPLEKLAVQMLGSVAINQIEIDDRLDIEYKPGLFLQVQSFIDDKLVSFQTLQGQIEAMKYYFKMAGY